MPLPAALAARLAKRGIISKKSVQQQPGKYRLNKMTREKDKVPRFLQYNHTLFHFNWLMIRQCV